jgi:uncharacterized protein (DUF1330 family)
MSAYVIVSYDIRDQGEKHGAYIVLPFESEEAALAWYNDPAYEPVREIRHSSCDNNHMVPASGFVPPGD